MLGFGVALVFVRRLPRIEQLDQRLSRAAEIAAGSLEESRRVLGRLTASDSAASLAADRHRPPRRRPRSADRRWPGRPAALLQSRRRGAWITRTSSSLMAPPRPSPRPRGPSAPLRMAGLGEYRYLAMPVPDAGIRDRRDRWSRAAHPRSPRCRPPSWCSRCCWLHPFSSSAPLRWATGWPAHALRPLSDMIDELEAITDGRSLHRRAGGARSAATSWHSLAATLNAMLARLERASPPAPLHRRRQPRAQDPAHGDAGRRRARPDPSRHAAGGDRGRWTRRWRRSTT